MKAELRDKISVLTSGSVRKPIESQMDERSKQSALAEIDRDINLLSESLIALAIMVDRDRRADKCGHEQCQRDQQQSEQVPQP